MIWYFIYTSPLEIGVEFVIIKLLIFLTCLHLVYSFILYILYSFLEILRKCIFGFNLEVEEATKS